MKIGIAVSHNRTRPNTFKLWMRQFAKHTLPHEGVEFVFHIQQFYPAKHKSIAQVKNDCLRALLKAGCDYFYLFDDDCFPIAKDWWAPMIEASMRTGQRHLLWLMPDTRDWLLDSMKVKKVSEEDGIVRYDNSFGCCIFLTRLAVLAVGAFDEHFGFYGHEHENYSFRCGMLKQCSAPFQSVPDIEKYIYSLDIQSAKRWENLLGKEYDPRKDRVVNSRNVNHMLKDKEKSIAHWQKFLKGETQMFIQL